MLIGYARVSTQDQNLELQREALSKAGCKKVFEDKVSGTRADRPGLAKTLEMLREGDTLVVWKLDRLGRSVKQLVDLVGDLHKHGVQFRSLTDSIDTGTPSGRFFFHVMASLAEMERELGTFFLTDYMVRHFERIVMQGMGLRKHPQLRDMYFGNYTRALYIAQTEDEGLQAKARAAAAELGLAYEYRFTGFGGLPAWVAASVSAGMPAKGD